MSVFDPQKDENIFYQLNVSANLNRTKRTYMYGGITRDNMLERDDATRFLSVGFFIK